MADQADYMFSTVAESAELERLRAQERNFDWISMGLLTRLGIRAGSSCIEVGVGAGSMTRWMASSVGNAGRVVGIDIDERHFALCAADNVDLMHADARTVALNANSVDFVHCRLVLLHLTPDDQQTMLHNLLSALKPGGWLVAFDPDVSFTPRAPASPTQQLWRRYLDIFVEALAAQADFGLGGQLPHVLRRAGFAEVDGTCLFDLPTVGSASAEMIINSVETVGGQLLVPQGLLSSSEVDEIVAGVRSGEIDTGIPVCAAWGRKPVN